MGKILKYRSIWISDIHLGSRSCKAKNLLKFLNENESEFLYLVGDIIDFWALKRSFYWPETHNQIIEKFLQIVETGTNVIYLPGNHDDILRNYIGQSFGKILLQDEIIHILKDGRKMLCIHGDIFDIITSKYRWIAILGDIGYGILCKLNFIYKHKSLASYINIKVQEVTLLLQNFEKGVISYAKNKKVDVILCGHIHDPIIHKKDGILVINDGDWCTNCSAVVETENGILLLLKNIYE